MEENKLIPMTKARDFDDEIYGVKIERRRRRVKKKRRVRILPLFVLITCVVLVVCYYSEIGNFFKSLIATPESTISSNENGINDTTSSLNSGSENDKNGNEDVKLDYSFIDTSPKEFTSTYEFKCDPDSIRLKFQPTSKDELYSRYGEDAPIVLLINLSPLEAYSNGIGYSQSSEFYSENDNVTSIGEIICKELNALGINTLHLKCDTYNGSLYEVQKKYVKEVERVINSNPSISYVFDISRALKVNRDMTMSSESIMIDGASVPTINFVCGTNNGVPTDTQRKSIYLSNELAKQFNSFHPLIVSQETISRLPLNQNFSIACIRIDIGSYASTFSAASKTAVLFSKLLSSFIE